MDAFSSILPLALQVLLLVGVTVAALTPLVCLGRRRPRGIVLLAVVMVAVAVLSIEGRGERRETIVSAFDRGDGDTRLKTVVKPEVLPRQVIGEEYVSSQTCRSCHPQQYASWHRTYHRTMTQVASPESILSPFEGVVLESHDRRYELERRGDEFWVRMVDPDWDNERVARGLEHDPSIELPMVERQIVMTTGSHHHQVYWVASRWGRELRQFPWEYRIDEQRWFPTEDAELAPPTRKRSSGHWNSNCINCHSVAGNPGLKRDAADVRPQLYSEVAELGIACEACHGPAGEHVRHHRNPLNRIRQRLGKTPDPTIVNPRKLDHVASSQICGRCHSLALDHDLDGHLEHGDRYRPGEDLDRFYRVIKFDDPLHEAMSRQGSHMYWSDGTCRLGGREFLGQNISACYTKGTMSCLSCHSMHDSDPDDQLKPGMRENRACLQCHESYRDRIEEHTHHAVGKAGSRCYDCHMPHTAYAVFTAIRTHRVASPRVNGVHQAAQPNACNLCHLDRSLGWAQDRLAEWYPDREPGSKRAELSDDERELAAGVMWMLKGDAAQRAIVAWHASWEPARAATRKSGTDWQPPLLAQLLEDDYSAVRFVAWQSLKTLPGYAKLQQSYDFVGSKSGRSAVAVLIRGGYTSRTLSEAEAVVLPRQPDGTLDFKRLDALWKSRDRRPVEIPE